MRATTSRSVSTSTPVDEPRTETRELLKRTAMRLFALRGLDGVSVRDIVAAAGHRNAGSVHYYFQTKEALIRELIIDSSRRIDEARRAMLNEMVQAGGPQTLRQVVEILIRSALLGAEQPGAPSTSLRFTATVQHSNRQLLKETLGDEWTGGYKRCIAHIRALRPDVPRSDMNRRLVLMGLMVQSALAEREAAIDGRSDRSKSYWRSEGMLISLIETTVAVIDQPFPA